MATFSTEDFLVVDLVYREEPVPDHLKSRVGYLLEQGVIERLGRGRGLVCCSLGVSTITSFFI